MIHFPLKFRPLFATALAFAVALPSAATAAPTILGVPAGPTAAIELVATDLPTVPRRRGGHRSKEKDKPYVPLSKDPAAESARAHKEYLKRYGF